MRHARTIFLVRLRRARTPCRDRRPPNRRLTISPPNRWANSSESAVFPLPVGPSRITASGSGTGKIVIGGAVHLPTLLPATNRCIGLPVPRNHLVPIVNHCTLEPPPPRRKDPFPDSCAAATTNKSPPRELATPHTWLRRKTRDCSARAAFSACCSSYGLIRVSTIAGYRSAGRARGISRMPWQKRIDQVFRQRSGPTLSMRRESLPREESARTIPVESSMAYDLSPHREEAMRPPEDLSKESTFQHFAWGSALAMGS